MERLFIYCLFLSCFLSGCDDDTQIVGQPEGARIDIVAALEPDFTILADPQPGRLVWYSTRAGRARFLSGTREVADQAAVTGGEICTTLLDPLDLEPGVNTIDIRLALQQGGGEISEQVLINVTVECTWPNHCAGTCVDFRCQ